MYNRHTGNSCGRRSTVGHACPRTSSKERPGLNPVEGLHAQEAKAFPHGDARRLTKQESAGLFIRTQDPAVGDEVRELGGESVEVLTQAVGTKISQACLDKQKKHKGGELVKSCMDCQVCSSTLHAQRWILHNDFNIWIRGARGWGGLVSIANPEEVIGEGEKKTMTDGRSLLYVWTCQAPPTPPSGWSKENPPRKTSSLRSGALIAFSGSSRS